MARVTIEDCLEKVNNRFMLVHLGAKRVMQLRKGASPLVEAPKNKEVVLALREIAAGAVDFDSVSSIEHDDLVSEALTEVSPDDLVSEALTEVSPKETEAETSPQEVQPEVQKVEQPTFAEPGANEEDEEE
jgi:DNA-directed RNA polymerase subunit omega